MTAKQLRTLLASAALLFTSSIWTEAQTASVQMLAINDFHGHLEPPTSSDGLVNGVPAGGAEYLATHLKQARRANPNTIVVAGGDNFGASPLLSALSDEKPTVESLEAMHLSITALGNHELDHGPDVLQKQLKRSHIEYLAANVVSPKPLFPATAIRTIGGVKIGFIGEILADAPSVISAQSIKGLQFLEESKVANEAAARLEQQGVHTIVLLIHQGGEQHPESSQPELNGCANLKGEIKEITEHLSPSIQIVVSAHTHLFYNCEIAGHTLTSAGAYGRLFTRFNLTIDRRTDRLLHITATNEIATRDVAKDPAQTAIIAKYRPMADAIASRPVGSITAAIDYTDNDAFERSMGDVIADAQLASTSAPEHGGAVIAFMNPGGIRAGLIGPAEGSVQRKVSFGDLYAVQPFGNHLTVHTMTGEMIHRLLEDQFSMEGNPFIVQVSDGFTYQYRLHAPAGQHVVAGSMQLHGHHILDTDVLRVEANDFMAAGKGSNAAFSDATDGVIGPTDLDSLIDYFKAHSPISPGPQNRITRID